MISHHGLNNLLKFTTLSEITKRYRGGQRRTKGAFGKVNKMAGQQLDLKVIPQSKRAALTQG